MLSRKKFVVKLILNFENFKIVILMLINLHAFIFIY